nr:potassium channel subfamily K member 18-like [Penaeus vannamei]
MATTLARGLCHRATHRSHPGPIALAALPLAADSEQMATSARTPGPLTSPPLSRALDSLDSGSAWLVPGQGLCGSWPGRRCRAVVCLTLGILYLWQVLGVEKSDDKQGERASQSQSEEVRTPKEQRAFESLAARVRSLVRASWKSFSYDHRANLQRLRQDATDCAAAFVLSCLFCLACAASFTVIEGGHQEELRAAREAEREGILARISAEGGGGRRGAVAAAQEATPEEEWKGVALRRLREVNEAARYGHIAPSTNAGRALTIVYAILGIPIFLILMADFGKLFTRLLKALFVFVKKLYRTATARGSGDEAVAGDEGWSSPQHPPPRPPLAVPESTSVDFDKQLEVELKHRLSSRGSKGKRKQEEEEEEEREEDEPRYCCFSVCMKKIRGWCGLLCLRKEEEEVPENEEDVVDDNFNLPISLALLILLVYIMMGCTIYTIWEEWTYFEAFYFIFISMTTIGFGDYVPEHPAFMMMTTVYLIFGLALTAMCINIIQEKLTDTFRQASEKLKESLSHIMAAASLGEDIGAQEGKEVEVAPVHSSTGSLKRDSITMKKET